MDREKTRQWFQAAVDASLLRPPEPPPPGAKPTALNVTELLVVSQYLLDAYSVSAGAAAEKKAGPTINRINQ